MLEALAAFLGSALFLEIIVGLTGILLVTALWFLVFGD